jgi:hypothetical protein
MDHPQTVAVVGGHCLRAVPDRTVSMQVAFDSEAFDPRSSNERSVGDSEIAELVRIENSGRSQERKK